MFVRVCVMFVLVFVCVCMLESVLCVYSSMCLICPPGLAVLVFKLKLF